MAAPPNRTELVDDYPNPSTGVFKAGVGKFYDYVKGLLGSTGNAAEARTALGAAPLDSPTFTTLARSVTEAASENSTKIATTAWAKVGFVISLGAVGYIKFPTWLGGLIVQWGTTVATSDGAAQAAFSFPLTFPSNVYTTVAFIGDNGDNKTHVFGSTATSTSIARFVFIDSTTGGGRTAFVARVNWVAFGN
jgi:hypothetical protein